MTTTRDTERISAKVPSHIYEKLNAAAEIRGEPLNQFMVQSALEKAETILEREHVIRLTERDAQVFFQAIENPPPLNERLLKAMKSYREVFPHVEN